MRLVAASFAAALVSAAPAAAQSFELPHAVVRVAVEPSGSPNVDEAITFDFHGSFHGAW